MNVNAIKTQSFSKYQTYTIRNLHRLCLTGAHFNQLFTILCFYNYNVILYSSFLKNYFLCHTIKTKTSKKNHSEDKKGNSDTSYNMDEP